MHTLSLDLTIEFVSRWHTGAGEAGIMANRLVQRDARNWPYVPASTLKGVIRHHCEKLCRTLGFPEPCDPHLSDLTQAGRFVPLTADLSPVETLFGNNFLGTDHHPPGSSINQIRATYRRRSRHVFCADATPRSQP